MSKHIAEVVKSALAAVLISLAFALLFTVVIQLFSLPAWVIKPVNQAFKILAVAGGGLLFIRGGHGLVKGAVHGLVSVLVTFLVFGAIAGSLAISYKLAIELLMGCIAGGITGVIAVNLKTNG